MPRDPYAQMAEEALPRLTVGELARLYRTAAGLVETLDHTRREHVRLVSAIVADAGGRLVVSRRALDGAPGVAVEQVAAEVVLTSIGPSQKDIARAR